MNLTSYAAFGLVIASELALPDLTPLPDSGGTSVAEVIVRRGPVPPPSPAASLLPKGLWVDGDRVGFDVPEVGRYACERGAAITVQPLATADEDAVRLFLLGSALGIVLAQRGHLVLHGNAFVVDGSAAVVLGHSGAGKSTLAAEMHRRGYAVLTDDVAPIDDLGRVVPGWPRIKLWRDAVERIGLSPDGLSRVNASFEKFHVPLERAEGLAPVPVRWIYVLDRHEGPLSLSTVTGAAAFTTLHEHAYRNEILLGALRRTHLARSAAVAASARITRLDRPRGVDSVAASADAILADIEADPEPNPREESHDPALAPAT